jgi:hypothetical protein
MKEPPYAFGLAIGFNAGLGTISVTVFLTIYAVGEPYVISEKIALCSAIFATFMFSHAIINLLRIDRPQMKPYFLELPVGIHAAQAAAAFSMIGMIGLVGSIFFLLFSIDVILAAFVMVPFIIAIIVNETKGWPIRFKMKSSPDELGGEE